MVLNLIDNALKYAKELRLEYQSLNYGLTEPLTPKAIRNNLYLQIRESLNRGCREASKLVLNPYKRSSAYSILVKATEEIFHYGKQPSIVSYYNDLLDQMIGDH